MTLHPINEWVIPAETARVARAAFPKGNIYMMMRDQLGHFYKDKDFQTLFRIDCGQSALSPGQLALITIMQFAEGLSDRQTAEAVRARLDWKYALGLELTDCGFDFSVLSEFRARLLTWGREHQLLDELLEQCQQQGWIKTRGKARTDSTHVLAAIRQLNRIECCGETLRRVLNDLATVAPEWLLAQVSLDWFDRYAARFEQYRLPKAKAAQQQLALTFGADGHHLLSVLYEDQTPCWLKQIPSVEILRQVWMQQYYLEGEQVIWRQPTDLPPNQQLIQSPYDSQARNRTKRDTNWTGYAVHLTETCDEDTPNLITNVETTPATTHDGAITHKIHQSLAVKDLLPAEHLMDTGYVDAEHLVSSQSDYEIALVGRVSPDTTWQAQAKLGFDISSFAIDWQAQQVTCPSGQVSQAWRTRQDDYGKEVIEVRFNRHDCAVCTSRQQCTRARTEPRLLKVKPQEQYLALQSARLHQATASFKQRYAKRAGVEGTISQGTRTFDLRRSRYLGLAKTHLQHIATAAAMNLTRLVIWLQGVPKAQTRSSRFRAIAPTA
jgi:transposase